MANRVKLLPTIGGEIPYHDFTAHIGASAAQSALLTDLDAGKALKMAVAGLPDSRFEICADGDEIQAMLQTIEPEQTSAGFKIGTVRSVKTMLHTGQVAVGATVALGDEVVAAAQAAPGVPNNPAPKHVRMLVKKAPDETGTRLKVVAFQSGSGAAGSVVTLSQMF